MSSHRPNKSLGQNFLVNQKVQQRIVEACEFNKDDHVIEIGPGQAAITSRVLPLVKKLIVIEKDRELADLLKAKYLSPDIDIVHGDFLLWDMSTAPDDLVIVGNIPYYISTPIIERILAFKYKVRKVFITVQFEFGQRLAAKPGNKDYGSLSCFVQYHADVKVHFKINPGSFFPQPKVDSCFVSLTMKEPKCPAKNEKLLFKMIQTAFMQRRKIISNSLKDLVDSKKLDGALVELGINSKSRPEELTLSNYIELSNRLMI